MTGRDEAQARALFQERYRNTPSLLTRQIEQRVIGGDWGANGFTTMAQADTLARQLHLSAADRLLDVGSGRGWPGLYLAARTGCAVVLTDLPLEGLRVAANRAASEALLPARAWWPRRQLPTPHPPGWGQRLLLRPRPGRPPPSGCRVGAHGLQEVVPRRRGAAHRTRRPGRPRHGLSVGAAVCGAAGRGRPACRHAVGDRWQVDETYVKVAGRWRYVYRAIDQFGQVIDVFVSPRRDAAAARRFFQRAIGTMRVEPVEVVTDHAPVYPAVLEELMPAAWHRTDRYANNHIEADHGRLKARLHPMRGLKQDRSARIAFDELALAV